MGVYPMLLSQKCQFRIASGLLMGALLLCAGCNSSNTNPSTVVDTAASSAINSSEEAASSSGELNASPASSSSFSKNEADDGEWKRAYVADIKRNKQADPAGSEFFNYALIYLDDDDIPELFISGDSTMLGEFVLTFHEGQIMEQHLNDMGSTYIPRTGLIENLYGRMGYYGDTVFKLQNHKFDVEGEGTWIEEYGREGNTTRVTCQWNGRDCSKEEYDSNLEKLFPKDKGIRPERWYNKTEMISLLETGHHKSFGHRYKIFNADVTWEEAWDACKKDGGYLATITSVEEQEAVSELIGSEGLTDHLYYVGYKAFFWLDKDGSNLNERLIDGIWEYDFPGAMTPGFSPVWRLEEIKSPSVGALMYSTEMKKAYVFNAPRDISSAAPQYAGKIGFICEYD